MPDLIDCGRTNAGQRLDREPGQWNQRSSEGPIYCCVRLRTADGPPQEYGMRVSSISQATKPGSLASNAPQERRSTILPTCQRRRICVH